MVPSIGTIVGLTLFVDACFPVRYLLVSLVCFSWWSDSGVRSLSFLVPTLLQVIVAQKFGPALLRPSPTTHPENGTNP